MCLAMHVALGALVSVFAFSGCRSKDERASTVVRQKKDWPGFFVEGPWVAKNWDHLTLVDARSPESYARGHAQGAIHLAVEKVERRLPSGRSGLLPLSSFDEVMASHGIGEKTKVIVYGYAGEGGAARLMWALDAYGHKHVALLVEGMEGWEAAGYPVDQVSRTLPRQDYRGTLKTARMASCMGVLEAIAQPEVGILDLRSQWWSGQGENERIPSSVSLDFGKRLMEPENLAAVRELQSALGEATRQKERLLIYGDAGGHACFSYFALRDRGFKVSLYQGGWEEWKANPNLPVELEGAQEIHQQNEFNEGPGGGEL